LGCESPINEAVVYPDCTRPPANPASADPVAVGTIGYLDVSMLPAGITEFTIYLDVFGTGCIGVRGRSNKDHGG
jgi:hypothetical protein